MFCDPLLLRVMSPNKSIYIPSSCAGQQPLLDGIIAAPPNLLTLPKILNIIIRGFVACSSFFNLGSFSTLSQSDLIRHDSCCISYSYRATLPLWILSEQEKGSMCNIFPYKSCRLPLIHKTGKTDGLF